MVEKPTAFSPEPNQEADEENASPETFSKEQLKTISTLVNTAIGQRQRGFKEDLESFRSEFSEIKSLLQPKPAEQPQEKPAADPKVLKLEADIKSFRDREARARDRELRNGFRAELLKQGALAQGVDALMALHIDRNKSAAFASDESEDIVIKFGEDVYSLEDGVKAILESADIFVAPKAANGSGDSAYKTSKPTPSPSAGFSKFVKTSSGSR